MGQNHPSNEMMRSYKCFPRVRKMPTFTCRCYVYIFYMRSVLLFTI